MINPFGIDFEKDLNPQQLEAVQAGDGPALVLAGAGSGKTRTLTYRVAWLLSQGIPPWRMLLLTFTNKAAKEMLSRVQELTGVSPGDFFGGTFHSTGLRVLRKHAVSLGWKDGFNILDEGDAEKLLKQVMTEKDPVFLKRKENPKPKVVGSILSLARNTSEPLEECLETRFPHFFQLADDLETFFHAYQEAKKAQGVMDFDDLLVSWRDLLVKDEEALRYYRERFQYILVDEFQDTNRIQSDIVDLLADRHQVMAVGDDAQSIYSWRGANYENILHFPERHPGAKVYRIETNYRSTPPILDFANGVVASFAAGGGFEKVLKPFCLGGEPPGCIQVYDSGHEASVVAARIRQLVGEEGYIPSDIAVLYRAHYQSLDLQRHLDEQGIRYQITSGVRFFEQAHVRDVIAMLRFIHNPDDLTAFLRFVTLLPRMGDKTATRLHQKLLNLGKKRSQALFQVVLDPPESLKVPADARSEWASLAVSLSQAGHQMGKVSSPEVIQTLIEGWYSEYLMTHHDNGSKRIEDLGALAAFSERYDSLSDFLANVTLMTGESHQRGTQEEEESVRLSTVHQAKGLEFPIVFVIGLADYFFPLRRAIENNDLDEEHRLFYVAVTRAQKELYLLSPRMGGFGNNVQFLPPSRFVKWLPDHLYRKVQAPPPQRNW